MAPQEEGTALTPAQQAMSDLWDKHIQSALESYSVENTLETMVDDPYVSKVSTRMLAATNPMCCWTCA